MPGRDDRALWVCPLLDPAEVVPEAMIPTEPHRHQNPGAGPAEAVYCALECACRLVHTGVSVKTTTAVHPVGLQLMCLTVGSPGRCC